MRQQNELDFVHFTPINVRKYAEDTFSTRTSQGLASHGANTQIKEDAKFIHHPDHLHDLDLPLAV